MGSNKEQVEKKLQEGKSVEVVVNETEAETKNKEQSIITDPVENVGSIKKQVENMLQEGTSVEDSESRIRTLKGILSILEKKDETVSEKVMLHVKRKAPILVYRKMLLIKLIKQMILFINYMYRLKV